MDLKEFPRFCMDSLWFPEIFLRFSIVSHGLVWFSEVSYGFLSFPMVSCGFSWDSMRTSTS